MLKINELIVKAEGKEIIKELNLKLDKGINVLMGPNGSGKTTLAHAIMGNPKYFVSGKIIFNGKNISKFKVDKRAKEGIFLSFQNPESLEGVKISHFLRTSYNSLNEKISVLEFNKLLKEKMKLLGLDFSFASRNLKDFSGGERKKLEMLQLLVLNPKLIILDETDSGLDVDALKKVCENINLLTDKIVLIITHYRRMLHYLSVDKIFVMKKGKIIKEGEKNLAEKIEEQGYDAM